MTQHTKNRLFYLVTNILSVVDKLTIAGVDITATAAELNILHGLTATAEELNSVDVTAAGTAQASKAAVLDAAKGIVGLGVMSVGTSNTSGVVLTSAVTNALQVVAEDGGVTIASGNPKAIKGRLFIKANPGDCTLDGILGQIKMNTGITASADYQSGIRGYAELVGGNTVNTGGANANAGSGVYGVRGYITVDDDLTISANHYIVGCGVQLSVKAAKTITATGKLAAFGVFADDQAGGATPTQAWGYGLYIPKGVVNCGIRIGDWVGSQASGKAVAFSTAQNYDADGQLDIVGVFGESTADLTSAYSAKSGRYRHLVSCSADTVIAHETYGLVGQLVVKNGSLNHYHAGIMGTFETGTLAHIQTGYAAAAIIARPGGSGTTVESGGLLAGFAAVQNMSAITATGTYAAFATHKTAGGVAWPIGLYMQSGSVTKAADITAVSDGVYVTVGALGVANGRVAKFVGSVAAPAHADGYGAVETDITASGTFAGPYVNASSTWLNVAAAAVPGANIVTTRNDGIYVPTGITSTSATMIIGGRFHYVADDGADPGSLYLFSTNIFDNALTALFHVNAAVDLSWTTGAKSTNVGSIPLFRDVSAGKTWYVNVYDG